MKSRNVIVGGLLIAIIGVSALLGAFMFLNAPGSLPLDPNAEIDADTDLLDLALEMPNWNFTMSDDSTLSLQSLLGKPIVIDLMATWCTTCEAQNANFETLLDEQGDSITMISLSVSSSDTISLMDTYKSERSLEWAHGLDPDDLFTDYFDFIYIPTIIIVDADGYFRWMHTGLWNLASMTDVLNLITE
ncbi:MAG: TlpA family protein disulfide reductase [Candidatus Thorarchaeota archaeon]|jgi:thiol-disulfide isomerase/thioredoxin